MSVRARYKGYALTFTKNSTSSQDIKIVEERLITGGLMIAKNQVLGDQCTFQVVDVDGVYYPAGTVLDTFVDGWFINPDTTQQLNIVVPFYARIPVNLYIRALYTSLGTTDDVQLKLNLYLYKEVA